MNDEQALIFMESVVDRTIVNVVQTEGFDEDPTTTLIFGDGTELAFNTDAIRKAVGPTTLITEDHN